MIKWGFLCIDWKSVLICIHINKEIMNQAIPRRPPTQFKLWAGDIGVQMPGLSYIPQDYNRLVCCPVLSHAFSTIMIQNI